MAISSHLEMDRFFKPYQMSYLFTIFRYQKVSARFKFSASPLRIIYPISLNFTGFLILRIKYYISRKKWHFEGIRI